MSKKSRVAKDGKRNVLVDGKDKKRLAELQAQTANLQNAFKANREMMGFVLKDYANKGEQIVSYNPETGMVLVQKQAPAPKAPQAPPVPPKEPKKKG